MLAALALAAYAAIVTYAATREETFAPVLGVLGAFGGLLLLFVLVRAADELLGPALALAGVVYAVSLVAHGTHVDEAAPLVAAGLLLCGELAAWSLDERLHVRAERGLVLSRAVALGGLALAGLGASALVVSLAAAPVGGGLAWTILGAAAAVAALAVAARLART